MEMAEEDGDPWIKASMNRIVEDLMGHYETSSIQRRIDSLARHRIIQEKQARIGQVKQYLLQSERLNELLFRRSVIGNFNDGPLVGTNDVDNDVDNDDSGPLRVKVLPIELEPIDPPTPLPESEPQNQHPVHELTYVRYRREKKPSKKAERERKRLEMEQEQQQNISLKFTLAEYLKLWNENVPPEFAEDPTDARTQKTPPALLEERFQDNALLVCHTAGEVLRRDPECCSWLNAYYPFKTHRDTKRFNYLEMIRPGWMQPLKRRGFQQAENEGVVARALAKRRKGTELHGAN